MKIFVEVLRIRINGLTNPVVCCTANPVNEIIAENGNDKNVAPGTCENHVCDVSNAFASKVIDGRVEIGQHGLDCGVVRAF